MGGFYDAKFIRNPASAVRLYCGRFEQSDLSAHAMYYIVSAYHEGTGDRLRLSYLVSPLYDELEEAVKAGEITSREARARVIGSIRWDMPSSIETD